MKLDNVINLFGDKEEQKEGEDFTISNFLEKFKEVEADSVIIFGLKGDNLSFLTSFTSAAEVVYMLEKLKQVILDGEYA